MNTKNQVEAKTKTYTTSELTSLCDVTVGSISVLTKKQNLKSVKTGQSNVKYHDVGVLEQLRLCYAKSKPRHNRTNNTQDSRTQLAVAQSENQLLCDQLESTKSITEVSRSELRIKNSQIGKLQDLTNQVQQLDSATHTQHQGLLEQKSQSTDELTKYKRGVFNWF